MISYKKLLLNSDQTFTGVQLWLEDDILYVGSYCCDLMWIRRPVRGYRVYECVCGEVLRSPGYDTTVDLNYDNWVKNLDESPWSLNKWLKYWTGLEQATITIDYM